MPLAWNVESPAVISTAFATAGLAIVLQFLNPPASEKGKSNGKKIATAYSSVLITTVIVSLLFFNAKNVLAERSKHSDYPRITDFVVSVFSFAAVTLSRIVMAPLFERLGNSLISADRWGAEHKPRVQRFAGQLWKLLYHTSAVIAPLCILRNEPWWPPGFGDSTKIFENHPHTPQVPGLREYYLIQLGYSLSALMLTLMQHGRSNLVSMTIHHSATIALVAVSYYIQNAHRFGATVMFIHDLTDLPVCLVRLVVDLSATAPTAVFYFVLLASWAFWRLYVFPFRVVWVSSWGCFRDGFVKWEEAYGWVPLSAMLFLLCIMHVLWFFELITMGKRFVATGNREDSTDAVAKPE